MQAFQNLSLDMEENLPPPESWKTYPDLQATEKITLRYKMNTFVVVSEPVHTLAALKSQWECRRVCG